MTNRALGFGLLGAGALGAWWLFRRDGAIARQAREFKETLEEYAGRSVAQAPTGVERVIGAVGRLALGAPGPSITSQVDLPAEPGKGPLLGKPRNLLGVAGKIRSPMDRGTVKVAEFAQVWPADAALENQSAVKVSGELALRVIEDGAFGGPETRMVSGGRIELAPGEFRSVLFQVPIVARFTFRPTSLALLFSGYKLDEITATRLLSLM